MKTPFFSLLYCTARAFICRFMLQPLKALFQSCCQAKGISRYPTNHLLNGIFFFCTLHCNAQKIIYGDVETRQAALYGTVQADNDDGLTRVFLVPSGSELSFKTKGLYSPTFLSDLKDKKFSFPFAKKGEWLVGLFFDTTPDGLIDLAFEDFYILTKTPVHIGKDRSELHFSLENMEQTRFFIHDFHFDSPLVVQVFYQSKIPLYCKSIQTEVFYLDNLPGGAVIRFSEDRNKNGRVESEETQSIPYELSRIHPEGGYEIYWQKPFHPLEVNLLQIPQDITLIALHESLERKIVPAQENLHFYDFKPGIWRFCLETTKTEICSEPILHKEITKVDLQTGRRFFVKIDTHQNYRIFRGDDSILEGHSRGTEILYFPGNYAFLSWKQNSKQPHCRENVFTCQDLQVQYFSLTPQEPSTSLSSSFLSYTEISAQFNFLSKSTSTPILFLQTSPITGFYDFRGSLIPTNPRTTPLVNFSIPINPNLPLSFFADFNKNFALDPEEKPWITTVQSKNIAKSKNLFSLPMHGAGSLDLSYEGECDFEKVYVEISIISSKEPILSFFMPEKKKSLNHLPLEADLLIKSLCDTNANQSLDESDKHLPDSEILLSIQNPVKTLILRDL